MKCSRAGKTGEAGNRSLYTLLVAFTCILFEAIMSPRGVVAFCVMTRRGVRMARNVPRRTLSSTTAESSPITLLTNSPCQTLFDLQVPEGRCVGIQLTEQLTVNDLSQSTHWMHQCLHPDEIAYGMAQASDNNRLSFLLGRLALREALGSSCTDCILKDGHGRPKLPVGYLGSISHKNDTAVALVAVDGYSSPKIPTLGVGVDLEVADPNRSRVAKKVLTPLELDLLGAVEGLSSNEEVLLRFSIKESLYKAMHPLICQYVGFQEVEVQPFANGSASVHFRLKSKAHLRFGDVTAHWRREGDFFLTSSSVRLKVILEEACHCEQPAQ